jgi:RimJ/RimL family protein N-acetyltransferase
MITQAEIILRPFRSDDFERLISWASTRADLADWCAGFFKYPLDERQLVEYLEGAARPNARNIFTATTSAGEAVGHIEISHIWPHLSTRLSRVLVAPNRRRLGIGRAMIGRAVEFSFSTHCVDRIDLGVGSRNLAAIACYKRLMFAEVGTWKDAIQIGPQTIDVVWMTLTRSAWVLQFREHSEEIARWSSSATS